LSGHFSNGQHQKKKNELPFLEANRKISDLSFIILKLEIKKGSISEPFLEIMLVLGPKLSGTGGCSVSLISP
jgi:hypothetical protein